MKREKRAKRIKEKKRNYRTGLTEELIADCGILRFLL
jgi:hypothetical protein